MGDRSAIEWTDSTYNPIHPAERLGPGNYCERVSPGCAHCYASRLTVRYGGRAYPAEGDPLKPYPKSFPPEMVLDEKILTDPLRWKKPRRIFVCSMTDLFGEWVPDEWIHRVFAVMALAPQHTFQVLTKRPARMQRYLCDQFSGLDPKDKQAAVRAFNQFDWTGYRHGRAHPHAPANAGRGAVRER